jgi:hypothetical protein
MDPSLVVTPSGHPAQTVTSYHPACEMTVLADTEDEAMAYVLQQNPGAKVLSLKLAL